MHCEKILLCFSMQMLHTLSLCNYNTQIIIMHFAWIIGQKKLRKKNHVVNPSQIRACVKNYMIINSFNIKFM